MCFFFKQKTAYEMRISDWSSDVCSSDLAGGVPAEWISVSNSDPATVILYLHGGGYIVGSINIYRDVSSRLCRASGARALVIEYRLAPEHPFPAAVDEDRKSVV